ncbi:MAG: response regulator [Elusimicrobia bacterium]|nr:response regulator [Elusimicrobiota bacterium]
MGAVILVVDDDASVLQLLKDRLASAGYTPVLAGDGYSALSAYGRHKPALVILDYLMPAGDGGDVLQRLRAQVDGVSLPVIFLTAVPLSELKTKVPPAPNLRYLSKPLDTAVLLRTIAQMLPAQKPAAGEADDEPPAGGSTLDLDADDGSKS